MEPLRGNWLPKLIPQRAESVRVTKNTLSQGGNHFNNFCPGDPCGDQQFPSFPLTAQSFLSWARRSCLGAPMGAQFFTMFFLWDPEGIAFSTFLPWGPAGTVICQHVCPGGRARAKSNEYFCILAREIWNTIAARYFAPTATEG